MSQIEQLSVFLASPGDVTPERDIVAKIIEETNRTIGAANQVRVEVVRWETDARPRFGKDGQAFINELIEKKNHAAFVVIFWNRFGSPTPREASGTLEEFKGALKKRLKAKRNGTRPPEIMLYFNDAPATFTTKRELDGRQAVLEFRASIKDGLYGTYKGKAAFERRFREDYGKWLLEEIAVLKKPRRASRTNLPKTLPSSTAAPKAKPEPKVVPAEKPATKSTPIKKTLASVPRVKGKPILLDDVVFQAENVTEIDANWTVVLRPQDPAADRKLRALSGQHQSYQQFPVVYDLQAGRAQITKPGVRTTEDKGATWTLALRFTPTPTTAMHQVNFGSMNADQIAQLKADWLLLAKKPDLPKPANPWEANDSWVEKQIVGQGKGGEPIFQALWKECSGDVAKFKTLARLIAVQRLLNEGVCEHVDSLEVGALRGGRVAITFRGSRASYSQQKSLEISVKGSCPLEATV